MKKLSGILFKAGLSVVCAGIIGGIIAGIFTKNNGFNFSVAVPIWLFSIIGGGGCVSISGSINESEEEKANDFEMLKQIIDKVKSENN